MGFPDSSVGKRIHLCKRPWFDPGLQRSAGEGVGYPLQYSWASLVARLVKNPPSMRETWVLSLGWEDPREKGKATDSSILAWRIPWTVESMGSQRVGHDWVTFTFMQNIYIDINIWYIYTCIYKYIHILHMCNIYAKCMHRHAQNICAYIIHAHTYINSIPGSFSGKEPHLPMQEI